MSETDIRPDLPLDKVDTLAAKARAAGWGFQANSNDLRVLHHLERYWFVRDYYIRLYGESFHCPGVLRDFHPSLIDCGCGEALGLRELLNSYLGFSRWVAVESDAQVCQETAERFRKIDNSVSFYNQNIEYFSVPDPRPPFEKSPWDDIFDAVICFEVLGFTTLSSDEALLKKLDDLCKPGGRIFLSTPNYRDRPRKKYFGRTYDRASLTDLIRRMWPDHMVEIYGQLYPTNRQSPLDVGVQAIQYLSADPDFFVVVAQKPEPPKDEVQLP